MTVFLDTVGLLAVWDSKAFTNDGHFRAAGLETLF